VCPEGAIVKLKVTGVAVSKLTVNVAVCAVVGVPDITPVLPVRLRPVGRLPLVIAHVLAPQFALVSVSV
jgi:hypothetical protein